MKILEVVRANPPEVFVQRHFVALREAGIDVHVVSMSKKNYSLSAASVQSLSSDIHVIQGPIGDKMSVFDIFFAGRYLFYPHTRINGNPVQKIFSSFVERLRPDLIHFHTANLAIKYYVAPTQLGIPFTTSFRGSDVQVAPLTRPNYKQQLQLMVEHASGIHGVCDTIYNNAINSKLICPMGKYYKTIYTTVPLEPLDAYQESIVKTFVSVGRFHWRKAYTNLLIAFRKYLDRQENTKLIIVGDGSDEVQIMYWIKQLGLENNVVLPGKLNYSAISNLLKRSSAYIQGSIAEGFSNAVAEAMSAGCPVFATNVGGTAEIIEDGKNGFLLDYSSPETWWEKLTLVYDHELIKKIRRKAWETANQVFDERVHANQFIEFYRRSYEDFIRT